jgi:hypothetical protein
MAVVQSEHGFEHLTCSCLLHWTTTMMIPEFRFLIREYDLNLSLTSSLNAAISA